MQYVLLGPTRTSLICLAAAAAVGALSVYSFPAALAVVAALMSLALLSSGNRLVPIFLVCLGLLLAGYLFAGRGFAHLGVGFIFVGELVVFLAGLVLLMRFSPSKLSGLEILLIGFMFWGFCRTVPYLGRDGIDALRDAVVWGYAVFAVAISFAIKREHLEVISRWYAKLVPVFVCWVPVLFVLTNNFRSSLPAPSAGVSIPFFQADVTAVHLSGIAAFAALGLYTWYRKLTPGQAVALTGLWFAGFLICSSVSRGAFLTVAAGVAAAFLLRPTRIWLVVVTSGAVMLLLLMIINPKFDVENRQRDVSVTQIVTNSLSVFVESGDKELEDTRNWRLEWWNKIIDYVVYGPYFWIGKGFGVNLADDDGFQVQADRSLRSPHNTHLTILARMGVPGFVLWLALNGVFVAALWGQRIRADGPDREFRSALTGWLIIYWIAMTIAGMFSLYLESPQTGIWFWAVFGLGLATLRHEPQALLPKRGQLVPKEDRRARALLGSSNFAQAAGILTSDLTAPNVKDNEVRRRPGALP